jgi:hypothetical protein
LKPWFEPRSLKLAFQERAGRMKKPGLKKNTGPITTSIGLVWAESALL